jgi:hypothetical protein
MINRASCTAISKNKNYRIIKLTFNYLITHQIQLSNQILVFTRLHRNAYDAGCEGTPITAKDREMFLQSANER